MTAPARLLALRVQGFKSFAERTMVEFGPGISAVVGPNGSGKSNLADALRWTLGEQGRALRSRKAEDVIWAGSERRAALGMADVTLVLDNSDGLLPVDYSVLEIGRRLYRSGENDYLLNRQRVRLRDLVDLLDAANLADNAFLFIGQGMVDQALALRPEERRPLFEEVAGVRRHERRRRKAEEQLAESEANLARVEDILAELRPQARRLAAQAEQQATRATAASELAEALLAAAHARWHEAAGRLLAAGSAREAAVVAADRAMAALRDADEAAASIAAELGSRATVERERRDALEAARTTLTTLQLREARLASEGEAVERDRTRLADERAAAEADLVLQRRSLAVPPPPRDLDLEAAAADAERALADALAELASLRAASRAQGEAAASVRRAEAARQAETETARRRLADAERRAGEERSQAEAVGRRLAEAEAALEAARRRRSEADAADAQQREVREAAAAAVEVREREQRTLTERDAALGASVAALEARLAGLDRRIEEDEARAIAKAARRRGGRRVDEDLELVPELRAAVEAALGEASRGYAVAKDEVAALAGDRGLLVVEPRATGKPAIPAAAERQVVERARSLGGGPLEEGVRRDPVGAATALLARVVWVPDIGAALELQPELPAGWLAVAHDGSALVGRLTVELGRPEGRLEERATAARLSADAARAREEQVDSRAALDEAARATAAAVAALEAARRDEQAAAPARRQAEEAERLATRQVETLFRESEWHAAQAARLEAEAERLRAAVAVLEAAAGPRTKEAAVAATDQSAVAAWEARVGDLRERRDRIAADLAAREATRREAESARARAEAAAAYAEQRHAAASRELAALEQRAADLAAERTRLGSELAAAASIEAVARSEVAALEAADTADRDRLSAAERDVALAREALRAADERLRAADHADVEARLGLESLREQLLVELAGLGRLGLATLEASVGRGPGAGAAPEAEPQPPSRDGRARRMDDAGEADDAKEADESDEAARLEAALDAVVPAWAAHPAAVDPPSPGRVAQLRRRYHELGAANPFAVEEYAELRARLETLETQEADLRSAISTTRNLIDELNRMIAGQFEATFRALETAFDRQFNRLFDGGYAKLSLTDPGDLSATGVEIVARPPGKKPQALAMLSGGERALTAVALLFAMLEVRPVPFCVLDEVDAALDEANVGRFSEALRDLAERTQFVVITHNRGTIEAADALYGVTVADDSVSRVISLRLDEARTIAGRSRGAEPAGATA